ncbi:MAG: anti-sigma factor [Pirellulales bacterium]|nr:anti-sigma factor [Pirellulales bacterium]
MSDAFSPLDRFDELQAAAALGDLAPEERSELDALLAQHAQPEDRALQRTAAAAHAAMAGSRLDALPAALRERLLEAAARELTAVRRGPGDRPQPAASAGLNRRNWLISGSGWLVAAASIAALAWLSKPARSPADDPVAGRRRLLSEAGDVIQVAWGPGKHPFGQAVEGDVVWSTSQQRGYMRFRGLPVNDPLREQYQLWIIDPKRDAEPIDGGVFDANAGGEIVVPIHAKLRVVDPKAFAITVEQPGGVVVSTQDRLPLLAAVPAG